METYNEVWNVLAHMNRQRSDSPKIQVILEKCTHMQQSMSYWIKITNIGIPNNVTQVRSHWVSSHGLQSVTHAANVCSNSKWSNTECAKYLPCMTYHSHTMHYLTFIYGVPSKAYTIDHTNMLSNTIQYNNIMRKRSIDMSVNNVMTAKFWNIEQYLKGQ